MGFSGIQYFNLDPGLPRAERFVLPEQERNNATHGRWCEQKSIGKRIEVSRVPPPRGA